MSSGFWDKGKFPDTARNDSRMTSAFPFLWPCLLQNSDSNRCPFHSICSSFLFTGRCLEKCTEWSKIDPDGCKTQSTPLIYFMLFQWIINFHRFCDANSFLICWLFFRKLVYWMSSQMISIVIVLVRKVPVDMRYTVLGMTNENNAP